MNTLYTTATLADFKDATYIKGLIDLNIGIELALLTPVPEQPDPTKDLTALKQEILRCKQALEAYDIPIETVRVHQPGGYMYYWSNFDALQRFFEYCLTLGFKHYIIHAPYGDALTDQKQELATYKKNLVSLVPEATLEVEEIIASHTPVSHIRLYSGSLLEQLVQGTQATILLDTYECGGIAPTINRIRKLKDRGFDVQSIHLHKDKHKCLTQHEVAELLTQYTGNLINEGFIAQDSSFDALVQTKSPQCLIPHHEKINILQNYANLLNSHQSLQAKESV